MGNAVFVLIVFNCFLVSCILWLITFCGSYTYNQQNDINRGVHFECGFFSINKIIPAYNFNFILSAVFLILYDIELLVLIPALFNIYATDFLSLVHVFIFIFFLVFSLVIDIESNTVKWYYN